MFLVLYNDKIEKMKIAENMDIKVNNINIHYEVLGEGKPIILLNGNQKNTSYMKFIGKALAKEYKVYLLDRRCCGKSEINCVLSYEESAKDIVEFIKNLNLDKPVILGHSGGGTLALYIAINYSNIISKLIVCSGVARNDVIKMPTYAKIMDKLIWYPGKKSNDRFVKLIKESKKLTEEDLNKINCETLIVNGTKEIVPICEANYIHENIKNSELLIIEGASHSSYMIKFDWYDKLKEFIEK